MSDGSRLLYPSTLGLRVIKKKKKMAHAPVLEVPIDPFIFTFWTGVPPPDPVKGLSPGGRGSGFRVQGSGFRV